MKKIVITGGSGLLGSRLLPDLLHSFEIHAISRSSPSAIHKNIIWHQEDLAERMTFWLLTGKCG